MIGRDEHAAYEPAVAHRRVAEAARRRIAIGDPFDLDTVKPELRAAPSRASSPGVLIERKLQPRAVAGLAVDPIAGVGRRIAIAAQDEGVPFRRVGIGLDRRVFGLRLAATADRPPD